jgi:biopolymer transport protein ExbD
MKKFVRVFLVLVMIIMTVTAVGCGGNDETTTVGGNATTEQKLQAVVNIIQRGDSVDVNEFFDGMDEESFEEVEKKVAEVVKGKDPSKIKITLKQSENKSDVDGYPYFYGVFEIKCESKSVDVIVLHPDNAEKLFSISVK